MFKIKWKASHAEHVRLSSTTHGDIDFGLPPQGIINQRITATTTYTIEAVRGELVERSTFVVQLRRERRSWWLVLLELFK